MKYLKTLALFFSLASIASLASCSQGFEDFSPETYSTNEEIDANGTKSVEPSDSTATGNINIIIDEPEWEDIDYVITIP